MSVCHPKSKELVTRGAGFAPKIFQPPLRRTHARRISPLNLEQGEDAILIDAYCIHPTMHRLPRLITMKKEHQTIPLKHTQNRLVLQIVAAFVESSCYFGSACEVLAAITLYTHPLEVLSQSLLFVVSPPPTTLEF